MDRAVHGIRPEVLALLALGHVEGVGYWVLRSLASRFASLHAVLELDDSVAFRRALIDAGARLRKQFEWPSERARITDLAHASFASMTARGIRVLLNGDPEYPNQLRALRSPPRWLFVAGRQEVLRERTVTVVGTRAPTQDGLLLAGIVGADMLQLRR